MKQKFFIALLPILLIAAACATTAPEPLPAGALPESEIAAIMNAANEGEVQQGQAAATRASSSDVRGFAQMMVADHTNALNNARDVFGTANVTPGSHDVATQLRENSQRTVTNLATYSGAAFDRRYMQTQVELHQWLLTSLDTTLIPSARNAQVRALLQTQRASVATHLDQARRILQGLPGA